MHTWILWGINRKHACKTSTTNEGLFVSRHWNIRGKITGFIWMLFVSEMALQCALLKNSFADEDLFSRTYVFDDCLIGV